MRADTAHAYAPGGPDPVRNNLERDAFAQRIPALLREAGGRGALLDLGCSDGLARRLAGPSLRRYLGVDLVPGGEAGPLAVAHDLRDGLGPIGPTSFDVYLATFGLASHLAPAELRRLLREIARHARPGALVALEALGLYSLEWPRLWDVAAGPGRTIPYRLGANVRVHPWAPGELAALYEEEGIRPLRVLDRSVQAGPKLDGSYWPGLPPLRRALGDLLEGRETARALAALRRPLPPLPASPAARIHHRLATRRARRLERAERRLVDPGAIARAVWAIEPAGGGGYGHGLMLVGRVER